MNDINFEALRGLWLAYGGEPDKELHPEAHGRWIAARMAEARRPDSRLSDFDEWARRERREQEKADDLHGVRGALEQLVSIADACRLNHVESLTCGELMEGVAVSGPNPTIDGQYVVNPEVEFHDGLYANGGVFRDKDGKSWFALDVDQELKASNPQELREIAELFRTSFAGVLDFAAREWDKQLAAGEVTLDTKEEA